VWGMSYWDIVKSYRYRYSLEDLERLRIRIDRSIDRILEILSRYIPKHIAIDIKRDIAIDREDLAIFILENKLENRLGPEKCDNRNVLEAIDILRSVDLNLIKKIIEIDTPYMNRLEAIGYRYYRLRDLEKMRIIDIIDTKIERKWKKIAILNEYLFNIFNTIAQYRKCYEHRVIETLTKILKEMIIHRKAIRESIDIERIRRNK